MATMIRTIAIACLVAQAHSAAEVFAPEGDYEWQRAAAAEQGAEAECGMSKGAGVRSKCLGPTRTKPRAVQAWNSPT
jgi:hypothetical protein